VMAKQASRQSTKNYCLFAVITVSLAIAASLFTIELFLRFFPPAWLKARMDFISRNQSDVEFGTDAAWKVQKRNGEFWRFKPKSEFNVLYHEFYYIAHIDELGGRSVIHRGDKSNALLPFLGDSFTFGVGVSDEETFSSVLSEEIQDVRIVNLGVPGTALGDQLKIVALRHEELDHPMKYVFFFFLGNDFSDLLRRARHAERNVENILWYVNDVVFHNAMLRKSYLIQFARRMPVIYFNKLILHSGGTPFVDEIFFIMDATDDQYYRRAQIALNLQLDILVQMQRELKFSSMIVAIPDRHQVNKHLRRMNGEKYGYDDKILDLYRPNLLLKNSVLTRGITFFDSTECLGTIDNPATLYYTLDDHLTAAGHKNFAGCVASRLKKFVYE
jgi:lysophospholipase L1-like esterase